MFHQKWMRCGPVGCLLLLLMLCPVAVGEVTISAAISLKAALEKAQPELVKAAGEKIELNFGASGTLAGQIRQGAPVDLFISADRANVTKLVEAKQTRPDTVQVIAENELVLIVPAKPRDGVKITSFADLTRPEVLRIAVGEPKVVPAGVYALQTLKALKLLEPLEKSGKLVTTENVAQVLAYVDRGEVDAGIAYRTDALAAKHVQIIATAPAEMHQPVEYVSVIPKDAPHPELALKLQKAILSEAVQKIFADLGFKGFKAPTKPVASQPAATQRE